MTKNNDCIINIQDLNDGTKILFVFNIFKPTSNVKYFLWVRRKPVRFGRNIKKIVSFRNCNIQ